MGSLTMRNIKRIMARKAVSAMTDDQLDQILAQTAYCESGVAVGAAADDQDMRRFVQAEIAKRFCGE